MRKELKWLKEKILRYLSKDEKWSPHIKVTKKKHSIVGNLFICDSNLIYIINIKVVKYLKDEDFVDNVVMINLSFNDNTWVLESNHSYYPSLKMKSILRQFKVLDKTAQKLLEVE